MTNGNVKGIAVNNSNIYLIGDFTQINGVPSLHLGSVNKLTGDLDLSFAGLVLSGTLNDLLIDGENLYVAGDIKTVGKYNRSGAFSVNLLSNQMTQ